MAGNPFEVAGRLTKAFAIAQALWKVGGTAGDARLMNEVDWANAGLLAGYKKPPSEETRRICIEKLEGFYRSAA